MTRSTAELGPGQHEPAPVSSTPPCYPMQWDMGAGTEFGVSTRRSFSSTLPHLPPGGGGERGDPLLAWDSQKLDPRGKVREHGWGWPSWRGRNIPESALPPPGLAPSALEESDFPGNQGLSCRHCLPRNSSDLFVSPGSRSEPSFGREWEPWAPALQPGRHSSPAPS